MNAQPNIFNVSMVEPADSFLHQGEHFPEVGQWLLWLRSNDHRALDQARVFCHGTDQCFAAQIGVLQVQFLERISLRRMRSRGSIPSRSIPH